MSWYKRYKEGIKTLTEQKGETPDGIWHQCKDCKKTCTLKQLEDNLKVCPHCGRHERIGSKEYFNLIFDRGHHDILFDEIVSDDFMGFTDLKTYTERLRENYIKTGLSSSISVAIGRVFRLDLVIAAMDFRFVGGSMGSVVGEKIARAVDYCIEKATPLMIISASGGARMMESAFALMQMAKVSAKLTQLADAGIPYLSFLTNPTTGGVSASFAMLGDLNFAEPNALIGFAGPRVIKETLRVDELPKGFQHSEAILETGFLDFIVQRKELRNKIFDLLILFKRI